MVRKELVEKRKHERFRSQDLAFAAFGSDTKEVGQITDIGGTGLAFRYIADGDQSNESREFQTEFWTKKCLFSLDMLTSPI